MSSCQKKKKTVKNDNLTLKKRDRRTKNIKLTDRLSNWQTNNETDYKTDKQKVPRPTYNQKGGRTARWITAKLAVKQQRQTSTNIGIHGVIRQEYPEYGEMRQFLKGDGLVGWLVQRYEFQLSSLSKHRYSLDVLDMQTSTPAYIKVV